MPVYLRANDRPQSTLDAAAHLWPLDLPHGLDVDLYDAVQEPPVAVASAEFPVGFQMMTIDTAPTARMAFVLGTAATRLFRTGVLPTTAQQLSGGSVMHCIEMLPEQRIAVDATTLAFARPFLASGRMINPPDGIMVIPSAPPVALRVLGTAVDPTAGVVSYQITFRMKPAASDTDSDQLVDLTVLSISVTPNSIGGLPLVGMLAELLGALVADSVAASLHASVQAELGAAAAGTFNEAIPDDDIRMTVVSLEALSPTTFEVEAVVGAIDGCDRATAAWSRFWEDSIVPAASEMFATDYAGAEAMLAHVRAESLMALRHIPAGKVPVARRNERLSSKELLALLKALVPHTSVRVANLLAVFDSQRT